MFRHENVRIQPDVLNINQTTHKGNEHIDLPCLSNSNEGTSDDFNQGCQILLNLNVLNENSSNHSNMSDNHFLQNENIQEHSRTHNEWNPAAVDEQTSK